MNADTVLIYLDRARYYALDAVSTISQCLCKPDATLKINGRTYKVEKLLGEGGFSFVYLIQDTSSLRHYALKKILISSSSGHGGGGGEEALKEVMKEVEAYRRFKHPNIIKILDVAVVQSDEGGGGGKVVYLFLPYYQRGNLQDVISHQSITNQRMSEKEMLRLFKGTCLAVRAMHKYRLPNIPQSAGTASENPFSNPSTASYPPKSKLDVPTLSRGDSSNALEPLINSEIGDGNGDGQVVFDDDEELVDEQNERASRQDKGKGRATDEDGEGELIPYAHRDIKPGNIIISDDGQPILMDFGSAKKARIHIVTRQEALLEQDVAAEHSTLPYRAPELFDVKTGSWLDEKCDVWSLGCTLFALAYDYSPFEDPSQGGGSIAMAVGSGRYKHPSNSEWSKGFKLLIDSMLILDPAQRPDIDKVIELTDGVIKTIR